MIVRPEGAAQRFEQLRIDERHDLLDLAATQRETLMLGGVNAQVCSFHS